MRYRQVPLILKLKDHIWSTRLLITNEWPRNCRNQRPQTNPGTAKKRHRTIKQYLQQPAITSGSTVAQSTYESRRKKTVFGVSETVKLNPVCSATETSYKIEISHVVNSDMVLSKQRITEVLTRLRGCAGWSVPLSFANPQIQVFFRQARANLVFYKIKFQRELVLEPWLS